MARIHALPSIEIIRGLKGILDFYVWRGLPCVRAWPKYRPAKQTAPSLAAATLFGAIIKGYNLLGDGARDAYYDAAIGIPRSPRDIYVTGVYGNLHVRQEVPPPVGKTLIFEGQLVSIADVTPVTVAEKPVPGCTVDLALLAGDVVHLWGTFDTAGPFAIFIGHVKREAVDLSLALTEDTRQTFTTSARDVPGAGTFTYHLTVAQTAGASGTCWQSHTKLLYQVWR